MTTPTLIINQELRDLLPPLSPDEKERLEEEISERGCLIPIAIWNGTIVDGHNRHEICTRLDIPFETKQVEFKSLDDAKFWIWQFQKDRRPMAEFYRGEMALKLKDFIAAQAKGRQRFAGGNRKLKEPKALDPNLGQAQGRTEQELAKIAQVSHGTLGKIAFLVIHADEATKERLRRNEKGTSIHREYTRLKAKVDAKQPANSKRARKTQQATSQTAASHSATEKQKTCPAEEKPQENVKQRTFEISEPEHTETKNSVDSLGDTGSETISVTLKSSPKVKETYCCGVKFEPDPGDDYFDWITEAERKELYAMRKTNPNRLVPWIHNFTIQNIPEHKPDQLLACLFSLFKVHYREKLAYGLLRTMFNEDSKELALTIVTNLMSEFQNQ